MSTTNLSLAGNSVSAARTGTSGPPAGIEWSQTAPSLGLAPEDNPRGTADGTPPIGTRRPFPSLQGNARSHSTQSSTTLEDGSGQHPNGAAPHRPQMPGTPNGQGNNAPRNQIQNEPHLYHKTSKSVRANIKIATQNMRGTTGPTTKAKWKDLNTCFKNNAIGLAAVQETHYINDSDLQNLNNIAGYRIHVFHCGDPERPNQAGVAIVLNKYLTKWREAEAESLIPGRAMRLTLPWLDNETLHVLAVYAPNRIAHNAKFWQDLRTIWTDRNLPKPDILLGDFNLTEAAIDREPAHFTHNSAHQELADLKTTLGVVDAWRLDFPSETPTFTWEKLPNRETKSRIDRIYLSHDLHPFTFEWNTSHTEVNTDHKMVSTRISKATAPAIGKGRWCIPPGLLKDRAVINLYRGPLLVHGNTIFYILFNLLFLKI
ncbi:hypothetical protein D9619_000263 [Psilocybe cf. subviscida]|uniref:Endonuclease/exonuclease/phosphatase domain-containing protein n=1 Tax=Psilocybe cf. subviscida TaxID=2480587 RepID=A0A8H5BCT5_9AGAR|nr:hypothetical protein D9619_000263 [Psilocybe cf. subviscida]